MSERLRVLALAGISKTLQPMASGWTNTAQFAARIQIFPTKLGSYRLSSPLTQPAIQCLPEKQAEAKI